MAGWYMTESAQEGCCDTTGARATLPSTSSHGKRLRGKGVICQWSGPACLSIQGRAQKKSPAGELSGDGANEAACHCQLPGAAPGSQDLACLQVSIGLHAVAYGLQKAGRTQHC